MPFPVWTFQKQKVDQNLYNGTFYVDILFAVFYLKYLKENYGYIIFTYLEYEWKKYTDDHINKNEELIVWKDHKKCSMKELTIFKNLTL